jgi:hypothetical protein
MTIIGAIKRVLLENGEPMTSQGKYEQDIFFTVASFAPGAENTSFRVSSSRYA